MSEFKALLATRNEDKSQHIDCVNLADDDLMDGDVTIAVQATTINYKDGLAITGKAPIIRRWPLVPGIDFCGQVLASAHKSWKAGDKVVLNGWGVGETHHGGFAERARVKGDWLVALPSSFTANQAMAIGTAGYTAMLAVMALEDHEITPSRGPVLVTGAAGGVGSVALALLSRLGFQTIASTGRPEEEDFLRQLGADEIIARASLAEPAAPLGKERWAGAIDVAGSHTLANVAAGTMHRGSVAVCGLAQGMDLPGSVAPLILRGVNLLGIDSVMAPAPLRTKAWDRLSSTLDTGILDSLTQTIGFDEIIPMAETILKGQVRGRLCVDMSR